MMITRIAHRVAMLIITGALALASAACADGTSQSTIAPAGTASPAVSAPVLAFAAGGKIYTADATGAAPSPLITGDRGDAWSAAPAFSPDGGALLFTRGYDIWSAGADGRGPHRLAGVADLITPPADSASNWSLGAQDVVWSPDGSRVAYVRARVGGSGISEVWTMRPDGGDRRNLYTSGTFTSLAWLDADRIAAGAGERIVVLRLDGSRDPDIPLPPEARFGERATPAPDGQWLIGSIISEQPIMFGRVDGMSQIGAGVSPALSPDGRWVAYFWHETLRAVNVDGSGDRLIADLAPLGGRDRHFAEQPGCFPRHAPECSYRPPSAAWLPGANTSAFAAAPPPAEVATPPSRPRIEATPRVEVSGLFTDPREPRIDERRALGPKPAPIPWDGQSMMLVDTLGGPRTFDLGQAGGGGAFSPDGTSFAWTASRTGKLGDGEVWLIDLPSGERRDVGPGRLSVSPFTDGGHLAIAYPGRDDASYVVDLRTGEHRDIGGVPSHFPDFDSEVTPDGYLIHHGYTRSDEPQRPTTLTDRDNAGALVLSIDAYDVKPAGRNTLAVATRPLVTVPGAPSRGTSNIFLVDIPSGRATFVATAAFVVELPLVANDDYVLWTDSACGRGTSRLYNRRTGRITKIDADLRPEAFTSGGLLLNGPWGGHELIDPRTFEYVLTLPPDGVPEWSPDHRYVAITGQYGGRDGPCAYF